MGHRAQVVRKLPFKNQKILYLLLHYLKEGPGNVSSGFLSLSKLK
jgi:hypothetical protein